MYEADGRLKGLRKHDTPVHGLIRRKHHWWQVAEALPYLVLQHGADLEIKKGNGKTPLNLTLGGFRGATFDRRIVSTLVDLGADVSTADLKLVAEDVEMIGFLVSRGAVVTHDALLEAIWRARPQVLAALLSSGFDPNTMQVKQETSQQTTPPHWWQILHFLPVIFQDHILALAIRLKSRWITYTQSTTPWNCTCRRPSSCGGR